METTKYIYKLFIGNQVFYESDDILIVEAYKNTFSPLMKNQMNIKQIAL